MDQTKPVLQTQLLTDDTPDHDSIMALCAFLEYVIHQLIYVKNIFRKELFVKTQQNGIPLRLCRDPAVREYILKRLDRSYEYLKRKKQIKIVFSLCTQNNEQLFEQCYLVIKDNDSYDESDSKLEYQFDDLVSICEDIQTTNYFGGFKSIPSGETDLTFNLNVLTDEDAEHQENDTPESPAHDESPWYLFKGSPLKKLVPFKSCCVKKYKIESYLLK